jgi:hypothetical protein
LMLLGSVLLLLLLGRQEASSLPDDPIFWDQRPHFLDRRQILCTCLDRISRGSLEAKELKTIKNNTHQGLKTLGGAHRDPVNVLLPKTPHHPPRTSGDLVEGEGLVRHLTPLQRRVWRHLVESEPVLRQRQHLPAVECRSHHPRRQRSLWQ